LNTIFNPNQAAKRISYYRFALRQDPGFDFFETDNMYLQKRNRILRQSPAIRSLIAETRLTADDFIVPLFIDEGENKSTEIASMPGYYRRSLDMTVKEVEQLWSMGLKSVLLFIKCKDELKDNKGTEALNPKGLMQRSIQAIKVAVPGMLVMTDVALDPFSSYGHDGIVEDNEIVNDPTVEILAKMSVSHAKAGADFVAPSDMMDGRIGGIRKALEESGFTKTGIMSYSAKYASCFYGPFRDALDSAPGFGDKKTYQMDYSNRLEAIKETLLDVEEGADIVMVKPALAYLDIIREVKNAVQVPVSAYNISGEYAMIKAAAKMGWLDENKAIIETLTAIKRAGADLIATYFAKDAVRLIS
jgi:porphobilinogen synthase